ncbi:MAG: PAS domain S-box protein [Acidobacteria bacterium]|nr:PAS domain S-box protein [Acidobacteriota bacterium]
MSRDDDSGSPSDGDRLRVGWNSGDSVEADGTGADRQIDQPLEVDVRTMSGMTIPVSFLGLMHDKTEQDHGVLAVARDMREHRSLINSLVAARTRFQELLEFAPDAVVLANQDGQTVLVNSQTENLFGYKRDELLGQNAK